MGDPRVTPYSVPDCIETASASLRYHRWCEQGLKIDGREMLTGVVKSLWPGRRLESCTWISSSVSSKPCRIATSILRHLESTRWTYWWTTIDDATDARTMRFAVGCDPEKGTKSGHIGCLDCSWLFLATLESRKCSV